jgi:hypothetical protein
MMAIMMTRAARLKPGPTRARASHVAVLACLASSGTAFAQHTESVARLAADTEVSVRTTVERDGKPQTVLMMDSVQTVRLAGDFTIVSRPMAHRRTGAEWDLHLAQFTVRHESTRRGVGIRFEGGLLPSPVGLAPFSARASANPTIAPAAPFNRGVSVEPGAPNVFLYPLTYPLGALASFSTPRWDARAGVLDSTPLRVRWPLERDQPEMTPQLLVAGGLTPRTGLRVGGWFVGGAWARASEISREPDADRHASTGGVEVEYSVAWTRLAGEWSGSRLATATGHETPSTWMIEGSQTLTPRWFLAGRLRQADARALAPGASTTTLGGTSTPPPATFNDVRDTTREIVVGYRATPDVTWRAGYVGARSFTATSWTHRWETSLVWAHRWR